MSEMLECPFCGKTPDVNDPNTFQSNQGDKWGYVVCCCQGPEVRTGYKPVEHWKADAIAAWNRRVVPSTTRFVLSAPAAGAERSGEDEAYRTACRLLDNIAPGLEKSDRTEWVINQIDNAIVGIHENYKAIITALRRDIENMANATLTPTPDATITSDKCRHPNCACRAGKCEHLY